MALSPEAIARQNPWWTGVGWENSDPHLRQLATQPVQLPSKVVKTIDLTNPGLHTLRGPRQVGKSTDLKLIAQRALKEGKSNNQVIYLQADLMYGQPISEIANTIEAAKRQARAGSGSLLLLDEVTTLEGWDIGIKALWDLGALRDDVVIATGSSAYDLYRGVAERWPGRRGAGRDHLVLPQSFPAFACALNSSVPKSPELTLADLLSKSGQDTLGEARLHLPALLETFELYLRFGGLPIAVAEAARDYPEPSLETFNLVVDSIVREIHRLGASEAGTYALLERIARSLGSLINWSKIATEMDIPLGSGRRGRSGGTTAPTVREYVELLSTCYFTAIIYAWKADLAGNDLSREKKLYFSDPLFYGSTLRHSGLSTNQPALIENVLALALLRRYEPSYQQIRGFAEQLNLHVWRSKQGTEIDFLAGPRRDCHILEVKYQNRVDRRILNSIRPAFPNQPAIIATRDELDFLDASTALIPAPLLAWALG